MTTKKSGSDNSEDPVFDHMGKFFSDKNAYELIMQQPTYATVWDILSKVDCSEHAEKKNGLTYLSWAWAWGIMMEHFPQATYEFLTEEFDDAGTCTVWCRVKIADNYEDIRYTTLERTMWLPVMDYKNKAITHPDSRAISDTRMRCLTKCLAMFGLGHYIYAGEDLPPDNSPPSEPKAEKKPAKKKEPAPKVTPIKQEEAVSVGSVGSVGVAEAQPPAENHIGSEEEADNVLSFMMSTADTFATGTEQDLIDFWKQNKQVIDLLDENYNEHYEQLKAHFTALRQKLKGQAHERIRS